MTVLLKIMSHDGTALNMSVEENLTGNMLKQRTYTAFKKRPEDQVLWFQKPGSEKLELIDDMKTLKGHGMTNDTIIKEGRDLAKPTAEESELRRNIQDKENFSYYYAHANETPLPESTRYVYGGDPIPLGKSDLETMGLNKPPVDIVNGEASPAEKPTTWRAVTTYSWADCDDFVKIYITQKDVTEIANKEGAEINVEYAENKVEATFKDPSTGKAGFRFAINTLNREIDPEACKKYRVGNSKVTLTLKKGDTGCKWYDIKQN